MGEAERAVETVFDRHIAPTAAGVGAVSTAEALGAQGDDSGRSPFIDLAALGNLLEVADKTIESAEKSEKEVAALDERRVQILEEIGTIDEEIAGINARATTKIKLIDKVLRQDREEEPLVEATVYDQLKEEEVVSVSPEEISNLEQLVARIEKLEAIIDKTPEVESAIEALRAIKTKFEIDLDQQLTTKRFEIENAQNTEVGSLQQRRDELSAELDALMSDERLVRRVEYLQKEAAEADTREKIAKIKSAIAIIKGATVPVVRRINEVLADPDQEDQVPTMDMLREAKQASKRKLQLAQNMVRAQLVERIKDATDSTRVTSLDEIAPWATKDYVKYFDAYTDLKTKAVEEFLEELKSKDPKQAERLAEGIKDVMDDHYILFGIIQDKYQKGTRKLNPIAQAFADRKAQDKKSK